METNAVIFKIKQLIKRLESNDYSQAYVYNTLYALKQYMAENNLPDCEKRIKNVYYCFKGSRRLKVMVQNLTYVRKTLLAIKEKNTVMARREADARANFFRKRKNSNVEERDLCKYDIIYVPTQGGYHYCVVMDVKKHYVECYPMTTASAADLDMLAVKYHKLEHPISLSGVDTPVVYITSSKRKIPKNQASHSFIGHYFCAKEVDDAIISFRA